MRENSSYPIGFRPTIKPVEAIGTLTGPTIKTTENNSNIIANDKLCANEKRSLKSEEKEILNTKEAADFLGVSAASLLNLSSNGKIPFYKFQRRNRYLRSELLQLLLAERRGGFNEYKLR
jgi:excisionase family DNA binding protein